jgi:hypothetical protein
VPDRLEPRLTAAGWLFAVGSAVHLLDHLRRGQASVTETLYWAGNLALVLQVVVITLIFTRHRLAPLAAAAAGFPLALGFASAHCFPEWSALSDPVWEIDSLTWLSYAASGAEIAGAIAVGIAGLAIVRARGLAWFGEPTARASTS